MKSALPVLAAVLALASALRAEEAPPAAPPPLRVGVVNIRDLYNGYGKVMAFLEGLEAEKKEQQVEIQKLEKEIKEKADMRAPLAKGSKLWTSLTMELVQLEAKHEYAVKNWNEVVKERLDQGVADLYNEIRDEIDAYAKEAGLTLVFKVDSGRLTDEEEAGTNTRINLRGVLYHDPAFDITKQVLKRLNDRWDKEKPAAPPKKDGETPKDGGK